MSAGPVSPINRPNGTPPLPVCFRVGFLNGALRDFFPAHAHSAGPPRRRFGAAELRRVLHEQGAPAPDPRRRKPQRRLRGNATENRGVFRFRADRARILASNTKLFTTAAALARFGSAGRLATTVRGEGNLEADGTWRGSLYLVGGGDPSFGSRSFGSRNYGGGGAVEDLAAALRERRHPPRQRAHHRRRDRLRHPPRRALVGLPDLGLRGARSAAWRSTAAWPPRAAAATSPGRRCSPPRGWTRPWAAAASTWRWRPAPATRRRAPPSWPPSSRRRCPAWPR